MIKEGRGTEARHREENRRSSKARKDKHIIIDADELDAALIMEEALAEWSLGWGIHL